MTDQTAVDSPELTTDTSAHGNRWTPTQVEEQKIRALELWMGGSGYQRIADAIGFSYGTAVNRVQQAIEDMRPHVRWDEYRSIQLAELEISRKRFRKAIVDPRTSIEDVCKAFAQLLKLQEREAALVGLTTAPSPRDELNGMSDEDLVKVVQDWVGESPELSALVADIQREAG